MRTGTFHNTEKHVFTVAYPLSVPVNAVDRPGHRMRRTVRKPPEGGSGNHPDMRVAQIYV
jgi:hypothetical protein